MKNFEWLRSVVLLMLVSNISKIGGVVMESDAPYNRPLIGKCVCDDALIEDETV